MQLRFLGKTGVKVSRLALGAMSFGGNSDEATSAAIWRAARDAGINFVDTADVYNEGRSEEIVGRLMAGERDSIVLASKAYFPTSSDPNARGSSLSVLFISLASVPTPFKGGTLLAAPWISQTFLFTAPTGSLQLSWASFPGGLSGAHLHFQYAIADSAAVAGAALSNAVKADCP